MTARRLAIKQPVSFEPSKETVRQVNNLCKKYPEDRQRSALIPALWIVQKQVGGWLPEPALRWLGDRLDMAYIRVYEVATFYTMFNLEPVGEHHVQLCGTTPCWLRGADGLKEVCERKIGPKGSRSDDGKLSWIEVECLGACANAPMVQISNSAGDDYYEDLTPESFEAILDDLVAGKTPKAGPQNDRHTSEPEGGATTLKGTGHFHKKKLEHLPNADKVVHLNYYEWDPKERRATKGGWVDPKRHASPDPTKRGSNLGRDLTGGIIEDQPEKGRPARHTRPVEDKPPVMGDKLPEPKVLYTEGPTDGEPDDLKKIKGIGPKFESDLNASGIYYYRQIGAWKAADIKTVESAALSRFPGRIKRDGWVKQAKALAKGAAKK